MESAGLQRKPREQPLPPRRPRVRSARKTHSESAQTDGGNSGRHRAGESESETFAESSHRDGDRSDAGRGQLCPRRPQSAARSRAANEEGARSSSGEDGSRSRRIQEMAANRFAPAFRRRFPARDGQVPKETSVRARLRFVGRRTHETGPGRPHFDADGHLRNRAAALQRNISRTRTRRRSATRKK